MDETLEKNKTDLAAIQMEVLFIMLTSIISTSLNVFLLICAFLIHYVVLSFCIC